MKTSRLLWSFFSLSSLSSLGLCIAIDATSANAYLQPRPKNFNEINPAASSSILYEIQARSANACRSDLGSPEQRKSCASKIAPPNTFRAFGGDASQCHEWNELRQIKLGTLDDLTENTSNYHEGITLKYIKEKVGADTVWIMPIFPNNDRWNIPDACDNLGSPYAVRDYMHASGSLDRVCILLGRDENTTENGGDGACWGNVAFDRLVTEAHRLGLKIMLDVALNHFGHNYRFYDYDRFTPIRERLGKGQNLDALWDYANTYEPELVQPEIIDTEQKLRAEAARTPSLSAALGEISAKCPGLSGDHLVRATGMWREMLESERRDFQCNSPLYLEFAMPGFYAGRPRGEETEPLPSRRMGDNYTNNWVDVKFLFHHEYHSNPREPFGEDPYPTFVRNREYLFRILNYWVSRGVDGFRLDHTTDPDSGLGPNEWKYLIGKVNYYDWVRKGRPPSEVTHPIFLAEEFHDQQGMNHVVDIMTEGYVGDLRGRGANLIKDTSHVERVLDNALRFNGHALVMRALETHDETRLFEGTGFDLWTGAGFWGIGATVRGTPMILMGQEFGEAFGLGFRKSSFLASRFIGHPNHREEGEALTRFYHLMNTARLDHRNRALLTEHSEYLRPQGSGSPDSRIFAQVKWTEEVTPNVVFTFHNLWNTPEEWVEQSYALPPSLAAKLSMRDHLKYRLVNLLSGASQSSCRSGLQMRRDLGVRLQRSERLQWLRLELCE